MTATDPTAAPPAATPGELDLDAIEARANAATPGPWHGEHQLYDGRELPCVSIGDFGWVCAGENSPAYDEDSEQGKADAEFIAHSRTDVLQLVAEMRRLDAAPAVDPGVYQPPDEPPASVTELWDRERHRWIWDKSCHARWARADEADDPHWRGWTWRRLLCERGPLSTTPPAGTEGDDAN